MSDISQSKESVTTSMVQNDLIYSNSHKLYKVMKTESTTYELYFQVGITKQRIKLTKKMKKIKNELNKK